MTGAPDAGLRGALSACVQALAPEAPLLIAFSGGLDSTVLLAVAAACFDSRRLHVAYVDHRLQAQSNAWANHCMAVAIEHGLHCAVLQVDGAPSRGESIEAWARQARYRSLARHASLIDPHTVVLTAHHGDDQLETILMRLARGTGIDGLAGIRRVATLHGVTVLRPFLDLSRDQIEAWALAQQLTWVEDPSNSDQSLLRNAVRARLIPTLDAILPDLRRHLPATLDDMGTACARLQQADDALLDPMLVADPYGGDGILLQPWQQMASGDATRALRRWFARRGLRMPDRARLAEAVRQLRRAKANSRLLIRHDGCSLRCLNGLIVVIAETDPSVAHPTQPAHIEQGAGEREAHADRGRGQDAPSGALSFRWRGQTRIEAPQLRGALLINGIDQPGHAGIDAAWLRGGALTLRLRVGGERLRPRACGPSRSLKNLYQERQIPHWQRQRLPILWARGRPVWAAGLGSDADCTTAHGERYQLAWFAAEAGKGLAEGL